MQQEYIVNACSGKSIGVRKNQIITIIDMEGEQVADFFAEKLENQREFLSTGVTIDCNESLKIKEGQIIYTNLYNPMFEVIEDDVKEHDLLHPCCRKEMYEFFYHNEENHSNCLDNINTNMREERPIIHPLNVFMNTQINSDGSISVEKPLSRAGDRLVLKVLMNVRIGISACSVSESKCNGEKCTAIKVIVEDS